jgi:4'-phosphopantetheinyl transferase
MLLPVMPEENEVHIWYCDIDAALVGVEILSVEEKARSSGFKRQTDARRYTSAHVALRRILAYYMDVEPVSVVFGRDSNHKPCLPHTKFPLHFNLSHSSALGALAVARTSVGVDIECASDAFDEKTLDSLAPHVMSGPELAEFCSLQPEGRIGAFFDLWTRKEALLKAAGVGMTIEPTLLNIGVGVNREFRTEILAGKTYSYSRFSLRPNFYGAVALSGSTPNVKTFHYLSADSSGGKVANFGQEHCRIQSSMKSM